MDKAHLHYKVLSAHRTSHGQGLSVLLGEPGQNPQLVGLRSLSLPLQQAAELSGRCLLNSRGISVVWIQPQRSDPVVSHGRIPAKPCLRPLGDTKYWSQTQHKHSGGLGYPAPGRPPQVRFFILV